jgi:excisionase family DNA binding protein
MAFVTIAEAAKLSGKDKKTLYRYIKDGKLSATNSTGGMRQVDVSELVRVFGALQNVSVSVPQNETVSMSQHETTNETHEKAKIAALEAENAQLRERLIDKEKHIEDMRNTVRLLEYKPKITFWKKFFG